MRCRRAGCRRVGRISHAADRRRGVWVLGCWRFCWQAAAARRRAGIGECAKPRRSSSGCRLRWRRPRRGRWMRERAELERMVLAYWRQRLGAGGGRRPAGDGSHAAACARRGRAGAAGAVAAPSGGMTSRGFSAARDRASRQSTNSGADLSRCPSLIGQYSRCW